jgi:hypothetical protein
MGWGDDFNRIADGAGLHRLCALLAADDVDMHSVVYDIHASKVLERGPAKAIHRGPVDGLSTSSKPRPHAGIIVKDYVELSITSSSSPFCMARKHESRTWY